MPVNRTKQKASEAASLMGRLSVKSRRKQWGAAEFKRRMQEWGKLGGRPKGSGRKHPKNRGKGNDGNL